MGMRTSATLVAFACMCVAGSAAHAQGYGPLFQRGGQYIIQRTVPYMHRVIPNVRPPAVPLFRAVPDAYQQYRQRPRYDRGYPAYRRPYG